MNPTASFFSAPYFFIFSTTSSTQKIFTSAGVLGIALLLCCKKKKLREQPNLSEPLEPPKNSRVWFGLVWDGGTITTLSVKEPELFISVKCFSRLKNAPSGAYFFVPFVFSFPFFRIGQALLVSKHEGNGVSG